MKMAQNEESFTAKGPQAVKKQLKGRQFASTEEAKVTETKEFFSDV
jgi:hypothetical protein